MRLIINGQARDIAELSEGSSVAELIVALSMQPDRVALELNGLIVSRPQWSSTSLATEDKLEIVHFVGGG